MSTGTKEFVSLIFAGAIWAVLVLNAVFLLVLRGLTDEQRLERRLSRQTWRRSAIALSALYSSFRRPSRARFPRGRQLLNRAPFLSVENQAGSLRAMPRRAPDQRLDVS